MPADNQDQKQRARALFNVATEQYLEQKPSDIPSLETIHQWIHRALEMDSSLQDDHDVHVMLGNICSVLGWLHADEGSNERSRSYYEEAIECLRRIDDLCWHEHWYIAKAFAATGRQEDSLHEFEVTLDLATPENSRGHAPTSGELATIWTDLADLHQALEQSGESIECLEWALSYEPDDEEICEALVIQCLFAGHFDRAIELSQAVLDTKSENRGLFMEYLASAAAIAGGVDLASRTYERLLDMAKSPEAREWYSRMWGYVEGLRDSGGMERLWNQDDWQWELHGGGEGEREATSLEGMAQELKEMRDNSTRLNLRVFQIERLPDLARERDRVRDRLQQDVFGDSWGSLAKATREALVEGELQMVQAKESPKDDYSSAATQYVKALEMEIAQRLLGQFQRFLSSRGKQEWTVGTEQRKVTQLRTLDLLKVRDLLKGWSIAVDRPRKITKEDLRFLSDQATQEEIMKFLEQYSEDQVSFIIGKLAGGLEWIPRIGRTAKHRDIVPYDELLKLRSQLIGSYAQPGLLTRLVHLFSSNV